MMDEMLGARPEPPLADAGEFTASLADKFGDRKSGSQMIALYLWWSFMHSGIRTEILRRAFGDVVARSGPTPLVVLHAGGTRFSLLLIAPGYTREARTVWLRPRRSERFVRLRPDNTVDVAPLLITEAVRREFGRRSAIHQSDIATSRHSDGGLVVRAVQEAVDERRFGIVLVSSPETHDTDEGTERANGGLAAGVTLSGRPAIASTIGFTGIANGRLYGITALHPLVGGLPEVDGNRAEVLWKDELTDSCALALHSPVPGHTDVHGPLSDSVPNLGLSNLCYGVGSGWRHVTLSACSPDIIDPRQPKAVTLYGTETAKDSLSTDKKGWKPGDCGAAQTQGEQEQVVAFSRGSATFDTDPDQNDSAQNDSVTRFGTDQWVWAAQVLARFNANQSGT